jgi:hypothetical protein
LMRVFDRVEELDYAATRTAGASHTRKWFEISTRGGTTLSSPSYTATKSGSILVSIGYK